MRTTGASDREDRVPIGGSAKIIGVGISKTGTSSLAAALKELGYRAVHGWPPWAIERADALCDVPAACRFRELDAIYPGSMFILTLREREAWLESCRKHWQRSLMEFASPDVRFEYFCCRLRLYGRIDFDPENHWRSYKRHVAEVRAYFAERPGDLLEIDITAGCGWEPLSRFLKVPVPDAPFPWKNRSPDGPSSGVHIGERSLRTVTSAPSPARAEGSEQRRAVEIVASGADAVSSRDGKIKVFVLGVPHTQTSLAFNTCPFTVKAWYQARMLHRLGHEVIHLGVEGSDCECSENVAVVSRDQWAEAFGGSLSSDDLDFSSPLSFPRGERSEAEKAYYARWAKNVREAILARTTRPWEAIVCCTWGGPQIGATKDLPQFVVESGIGYRHTWAKYRVFISYAWMHFHYGREGKYGGNGWYDVVIPNAVDPELFDFRPNDKSDELLYLGRLNNDKGIELAIDLARRTGRRLAIVGPGNPRRFLNGNPHVRYLPPVDVEGRRKLMAEAAALVCPTQYIEPLGNVALEAQVSGTPVICTDWGGFTESVLHGMTGWRCRTMEQFVWAAKNLDQIDPAACRQWVIDNYAPQRIGRMFDEYFHMLLDLSRDGWYEERPERDKLDWLQRRYPAHKTRSDR